MKILVSYLNILLLGILVGLGFAKITTFESSLYMILILFLFPIVLMSISFIQDKKTEKQKEKEELMEYIKHCEETYKENKDE